MMLAFRWERSRGWRWDGTRHATSDERRQRRYPLTPTRPEWSEVSWCDLGVVWLCAVASFSYFYARVACTTRAARSSTLRYCTGTRRASCDERRHVSRATFRSVYVRRADVVTPTRHSHTDGSTRLTGSRSRAARRGRTQSAHARGPRPRGHGTRRRRTAGPHASHAPPESFSENHRTR